MTRRLHVGRLVACVCLLWLSTGCAAVCHDMYNTGAKDALTALEAAATPPQDQPCPALHYRVPVVSHITLPTRIVGGVLIPAHQTYVVLEPGAWQRADRKQWARAKTCQPPTEGAP
jgi:hypothetical protein